MVIVTKIVRWNKACHATIKHSLKLLQSIHFYQKQGSSENEKMIGESVKFQQE